jgi:hypothetical protein
MNTLKVAATISLGGLILMNSCSKGTTPIPPPVHDTIYAPRPDTTVNLAKGLLLYLPFSGNIADSSGNANPTQAVNGAGLTYDEHGYANNAFGANGTNQVILVTNNGSIKFDTAYSISLDFMTNDVYSLHCYISMVNWDNGYAPSFEFGTTVPAYLNRFDLGVNDSSAGCDNYGGANLKKLNDTTGFMPSPGAWYNAVLIYHRGSVQMYINGSLIASPTGNGTIANLCPASKVVIGGWWSGDPENINGKLDNIRLYNRVLTPHEIAALASHYQVNSNSVAPRLQTH